MMTIAALQNLNEFVLLWIEFNEPMSECVVYARVSVSPSLGVCARA